MHRASADITRLAKTGATLVTGDVIDEASLEAIVPDNLDAIFHAAADTSQWSGNNQRQDAVNITGTANMLSVAKAKGVGRFIYTSSISAYGRRDDVIDETFPSVSANSPNNYERSKFAAEQQVKAACEEGLEARMALLLDLFWNTSRRTAWAMWEVNHMVLVTSTPISPSLRSIS